MRAFDVRTGKLLWTFNTIPRPGEFGNDTWENDSWAVNGNVGVWTQITVDEELGLVYLPVETPTSDFYGGHRPGNNLFAESLVCVDLKTGQRKWHFQFVHHPLWNYDMSSAAILADITVNGKPIKAVAVPASRRSSRCSIGSPGSRCGRSKSVPVPQSDVPGEKTSPTQPFPTKPPAYARNTLKVPDDLIDFTPELRAQAIEQMKRYKVAPWMYNPRDPRQRERPARRHQHGQRGRRHELAGRGLRSGDAHASAPGQQRRHHGDVARAAAGRLLRHSLRVGCRGPPVPGSARPGRLLRGRFTARAGAGAKPRVRQQRRGRRRRRRHQPQGGGLTVDGLSILKPPYGTISAVNLDRGEIVWQVPHGDTPDNVRNHPALKGLNIPKTGQAGTSGIGLMVTKTLVVMGDPAADDDARASARRDAARLRQDERQSGRSRVHGGAAERLADDLSRRRQAVHRRRHQRRQLLGRVRGVHAARMMGPSGAAS